MPLSLGASACILVSLRKTIFVNLCALRVFVVLLKEACMGDIRVGIVGYGWVAGAHITSFHEIPGVKVTAICSRRSLNADELSSRHGSNIHVFNDYARMCEQPDLA